MWQDGPEEDIERVHLPLPERFSHEPERFVHPTMDPRGTQIVAVAARSRLIRTRPRNRLLGTVRYFFRYRTALGYPWLGVGMPVPLRHRTRRRRRQDRVHGDGRTRELHALLAQRTRPDLPSARRPRRPEAAPEPRAARRGTLGGLIGARRPVRHAVVRARSPSGIESFPNGPGPEGGACPSSREPQDGRRPSLPA